MADDAPSVAIRELSREECEQLLAGHGVGRMAVVADGQPYILPVNYATPGGGEVVFRTAAGSLLNEASLRQVAFEVDDIDPRAHEGWSVLVLGWGRDIGDAIDADSVALRQLPLATWAPGERHQWYKIVPTAVTGRRLSRA